MLFPRVPAAAKKSRAQYSDSPKFLYNIPYQRRNQKKTADRMKPDEETGPVKDMFATGDETAPTWTNFKKGTSSHKSRRSKNSVGSFCAANSWYAAVSVNTIVGLLCANAVLCLGGINSILSIGCVQSILSVGSVNSVLSVGCVGKFMKICV